MMFESMGFLRAVLVVTIFFVAFQAKLQYEDVAKFNNLELEITVLKEINKRTTHERFLTLENLRRQQDVLMYTLKKLEDKGQFDKEIKAKLTTVIEKTDLRIHRSPYNYKIAEDH